MFGFSFGFSFDDFGLRPVEDRSTPRFSFGLRLVYVRSTFGLLLVCFRSTSGHRSIYVRPTFGLRYDFSSAFRSGYVKSTFNLRCLRSVYARSTFCLRTYLNNFSVLRSFSCALNVQSTFGLLPVYDLLFVRSTSGLRSVYVRITLFYVLFYVWFFVRF